MLWPLAISNIDYSQVSYDPRSYERNLCNCGYKPEKNSGLLRGLNLAKPVRRANQLSYEATDVGGWSFVSSNDPVRNECEVIYEMFHILNFTSQFKYMKQILSTVWK